MTHLVKKQATAEEKMVQGQEEKEVSLGDL